MKESMKRANDAGVMAVDHVGFSVSSLDEAIDFWTGVMGFELVRRSEMGGENGVRFTYSRLNFQKWCQGQFVEESVRTGSGSLLLSKIVSGTISFGKISLRPTARVPVGTGKEKWYQGQFLSQFEERS